MNDDCVAQFVIVQKGSRLHKLQAALFQSWSSLGGWLFLVSAADFPRFSNLLVSHYTSVLDATSTENL